MTTLTTDESVLYGMSREQLARHGRAVQQMADAAHRSLADFTVRVLGLPPYSSLQMVREASAAAALVGRCREILDAVSAADEVTRAYSETLRRRGL